MRILHLVATDGRRGAEQFTVDLAGSLCAADVEQRIFVMRTGEPGGIQFPVPVVYKGPAGYGLPGLGMRLKTARSLRRFVRDWVPDVLLAHGGEALKYAGMSTPATPLVYRRIGSTPDWMAGSLRRRAWALLMRRATKIVAVSDITASELVDVFGLARSRVTTIPNGVARDRVAPRRSGASTRASLGVHPQMPLVLTLAALTDEKDPTAIVRVAERLGPGAATFLIAGDGPFRSTLKEMIASCEPGVDVRVLGERSDVPDLLAAADLMLLTSRTEGLPGALIEAAFAGLPRVATSVGGVPEAIADGSTGLLASAGDLEGLSACVRRLIDNPGLRTRIAHAARADAVVRFSIDVIADRYLELLRQVALGPAVLTHEGSAPGRDA